MADPTQLSLAEHASDLWKIFGSGVLGLALYIWHRREQNIERLTESIEEQNTNCEKRIADVYTHIETIRSTRDKQMAEIDKRLTVLETEHKSCSERLRQLEKGI